MEQCICSCVFYIPAHTSSNDVRNLKWCKNEPSLLSFEPLYEDLLSLQMSEFILYWLSRLIIVEVDDLFHFIQNLTLIFMSRVD